jgi:hypothetical protein
LQTGKIAEARRLWAWQKVADYFARIADANLNVVERMQPGIFVERFAFDKKCAHCVERCFGFFLAQFVECFKDRPVEITCAQVASLVLQGLAAGYFAEFQIRRVSGFNQVEMFGVNEVEAIAEVDDCPEEGGSFDFAGFLFLLRLAPSARRGRGCLPKNKSRCQASHIHWCCGAALSRQIQSPGQLLDRSRDSREPANGKPLAILRLYLTVGGIHAGGNQKAAGGFFGSGDFTRGFPDFPDLAFHVLCFESLLDDCHSAM